ncbi:MAG: polysaccharide deacetylase family protein [Thermodesulfobacteriota bacterium]
MLSAAEKCGITAFLLAILLSLVDVRLATIPLFMFILLCAGAPFFPRYGFFLPVVSRGITGKKAIALTFDDGPDPVSTPALLRLLARHRVRATFFVNGTKAEQSPDLIREILNRGHTIGNHTHTHDNLVMFKSSEALKREIETAQQVLKHFGIQPLAFRPPVGVTNPKLRGVLNELGMYTLNFSCRAGDRGNRDIRRLAERILARVHPDAVIALHDVRPRSGNTMVDWIREVDLILWGLKRRGYAVLPLPDLIGRPVMRKLSEFCQVGGTQHPCYQPLS